jgi:transposase
VVFPSHLALPWAAKMIRLELSDQELSDIAEALDDPATPEKNKAKLLVIRMHHAGARHGFIAKVLNLHSNTITNHLKEYSKDGLPGTLEDRYYRPSSSLEPFLACLKCSFQVSPVADAKQAVARIESLTGVRLSESQVRRFMKSLGMKVRKACSIPGKADPQLQFEFYTTTLLPKLEEAGRAERKVFFVDAAHFVMGAFLGMIWCFARVLVKTPPGRKRYNVLGAIDSHSQELISIRTTENINSLSVVALLKKIREKHPDTEVTLVMDNASYQRCYYVRDHAKSMGIELLFLPSYSPNLNLIERLWKLTKRRCLTNRYYADFGAFCRAIDKCLEDLSGPLKNELTSLMTLNFQFFQNHKS